MLITNLPSAIADVCEDGTWQEITIGCSGDSVFRITHSQRHPSSMQLSGFIDLGRVGIADRYQDLELAVRSLPLNFGPSWEPLLWEAYGLKEVDVAKIEFYQLLDEFF